jgi:hypothetical protein
MNTRKLTGSVLSCSVSLATALVASDASAQNVSRADYFIRHQFSVTPSNSIVTNVRGIDFAHAWVTEPGRSVFQTSPAAQPPQFAPFGNDALFANNFVLNRAAPNAGFGVLANRNNFNVPMNGINRLDQANIPAPVSSARGRTIVNVQPWSPGSTISGTITSDGFAEARLNGAGNASAYSFSMGSVEARGFGWGAGQISWSPTIRDTISGSAQANVSVPPTRRRSDPLSIRMFDSGGLLLDELLLLDIETELFSDGQLIWENGMLNLNGPDADMTMFVNPLINVTPGDLDFRVRNNVVVTSVDNGMFDGLLPAVGSVGPFNFAMPQTIQLNYTMPAAADYELVMGGGQHVESIPEPAAALAMISLMPLLSLRRKRRDDN